MLSLSLVLQGFLALTPARAGVPTNQNLSMLAPIVRTERGDAGVVRIVYKLDGAAGTLYGVALEVSNDGGQSFGVRASAVTGDVGPGVSGGGEKTIVWDSAKDTEDLQLERLVFRVRVRAPAGSPVPVASAPSPAPPSTARGAATAGATKGGGLSKGAIAALTGGAAAAGIGVAVAKGKESAATPVPTPTPTAPATTTIRVFRGTATGPITFDFPVCLGRGPGTQTEDWTFTLTASLTVTSTGSVSGSVNGGITRVLVSGCPGTAVGTTSTFGLPVSQIGGTTSNVTFSGTQVTETRTNEWSFTGSVAGDVLSGTLLYTATIPASAPSGAGRGSAAFSFSGREQ